VGWFQHAEAEFTLAHLPANSYVCYVHVIRALSSEVLTAVRDLTRDITASTPEPYLLMKDPLLSRFTTSPLQQCFRLLDMPPLGDRYPSVLFAEMQSLLPRDANILFNAIFLRRLPESIRLALVDKGEILPGELAAAADLLQNSAATLAASVNPAPPSPRWPQSMWCTRLLGGNSPACRRSAAVQSRLIAVSPPRIAATHLFLGLPPAARCASITTTSAAKLAAVNPPAPGRETSSGPGGTCYLAFTARGRPHLPEGLQHSHLLPGGQWSSSQPGASSVASSAHRTSYC
jgi:hypothetical protein